MGVGPPMGPTPFFSSELIPRKKHKPGSDQAQGNGGGADDGDRPRGRACGEGRPPLWPQWRQERRRPLSPPPIPPPPLGTTTRSFFFFFIISLKFMRF